tara:strand:+ start:841 stop:1602 length:762 start_codon:yes stop_codon:yes gene_type:complete
MYSKLLVLFICIVSIIGCKKEQSLSFSSENFSEKELPNCKTVICPEITINYFTVSGEESVSTAINAELKKFIVSSLQIGEKPVETNSIDKASSNFIKTYRKHSAEFPDMAAAYFAEINVRKSLNTPEILSVELQQYKFTGGAHGYGSTTFANFDPKTGELLQQKDLFNDVEGFKHFAETAFRKQHNISEEESINSTGFWFENDTFYLPETVGFTKDDIIIIYNQYNIASYADGPIELKLPIEKAKEFLAFSVE